MREIKTIVLSGCEVDIVTYITWGEKEDIQTIVQQGVKMDITGISGFNPNSIREAKYKAFEICIKEIRQDGQTMPYSREWVDNLSIEDGDALYEAINEITEPKKKQEK